MHVVDACKPSARTVPDGIHTLLAATILVTPPYLQPDVEIIWTDHLWNARLVLLSCSRLLP
jgi:hypothetical protein